MKIVNPAVAVLVDLCRKHSCSPRELFASISLNKIPKEFVGLNALERAAIIEQAERALKHIEQIEALPPVYFHEHVTQIMPDLRALATKIDEDYNCIKNLLERIEQGVYKSLVYDGLEGGTGLTIKNGRAYFHINYAEWQDLSSDRLKEVKAIIDQHLREKFVPWVKSQLGN